MKHLKPYDSSNGINESFWTSIFGNPTIKDASDTAFRGQGFSHKGKEDEENYIMFQGQKFYPEQIQYDDYHSTKQLPRIEDGKLIVANPAWSM